MSHKDQNRVQEQTAAVADYLTDCIRFEPDKDYQSAGADGLHNSLLSKHTFISKICHDLRSPLNAVIGFSQIGKLKAARQDPAKVIECLTDIETAGYDLLYILNELHDYARLATNRIELRPVSFAIAEVMNEIRDELASLATSNNNRLIIRLEQDSLMIEYDRDRFRQLIHIFVHNALKFTRDGEVVITLKPDNRHAAAWQLVVADNGPGMAAEQLAGLFDEELQMESAHTRHSGGLGLGIAIAQRLAQILDIRFEIHSKPGTGTRVTLFC